MKEPKQIPKESWLRPGVVVRSSPIHGEGLFNTDAVVAGEVVEVLGGNSLTDAEVEAIIESGQRYDGVALASDLNLSIEPVDWPGIHGNHSCDPNLWMDDAVTVVARREIAPGEELTVDYALYTATSSWSMQCNCGASNCRGVITGNDWQIRDLQTRYRGHFAPMVTGLIEAAGA